MTSFSFKPAQREQAKARIALSGPSGSGKTYTALRIAAAMGDRVAVIDTEHGSASKYAAGRDGEGFTFDALELDNFDPRNLIGALAAAAQAQYPVVVVDSLTHFWSGVGGMLEQVDNAARRYGNNSFAGWKDARPVERQLIEALLAYPGHVIVTMRSKTEYVIEENERGKKTPRKVGMKPEQREGIEYEFDIVGDLDFEHTLMVSKSRCAGLSGAVIREPGEELGRQICEWLDGGVEAPDASQYVARAMAEDLTYDQARVLHEELKQRRLLSVPLVHPESGEPVALGDYVVGRGLSLRPVAVA